MPDRALAGRSSSGWRAARLSRAFYSTDAAALARALLGQRLVRVLPDGRRLAGIIVETEAYLGVRDRAAHSFAGRRTPRNEAMYAPGGTAYVYFTYGMHFCFNIVAGRHGEPVAVLVRALEPCEGLEEMRRRRTRAGRTPPDAALCRGPGSLCRALGIDRAFNGADLTTDPRLFVERGTGVTPRGVGVSRRIGVACAGAWACRRLRFFIRGHPCVSGPASLNGAAVSPVSRRTTIMTLRLPKTRRAVQSTKAREAVSRRE